MKYVVLLGGSFLLVNLLFCSGCVEVQRNAPAGRGPQPTSAATAQNLKENQSKGGRRPQEDVASRGQRVAVPEIEGCERDNVTFFRGAVRYFKRTTDAVEITIRTEWDSDEELRQPTDKDRTVVYRLESKRMEEGNWGLIISKEGTIKPNVRATVWVCERDGEQTIKIIDWHLADSPAERTSH
ncbi:MAG: hypothetical protein LC803_23010 [Acidobacteria bacterium]|nr:hypothetical protein [Acidobacteriota bacterium]